MINYRPIWMLSTLLVPSSYAADMDLPQSPLQSKTYVAPNVMLMIDNSGSMRYDLSGDYTQISPTKMDIAKGVAKGVIEDNPDIRFCLTKFNLEQGGQITSECKVPTVASGATQSDIANKIDALTPATWTPLAETYYEIIRYFAGKTSAYNSGVTHNSPIQYRCQKNFSIILTDGEPTRESDYPNLSDMNDIKTISSANYDGVDNDNDGASSVNGDFRYLDDFAKYAWDADLKPSGVDDAGKSYEDTSISGGGEPGRQNMYTYTVGFNVSDPMLEDAANYGHGIYREASSATGLRDTFANALKDITSLSQSVGGLSASSDFLIAGASLNIFQSRYYSKDWNSELLSWKLNPTTYKLDATPIWKAPRNISRWQDRILYTGYKGGSFFRKKSFTSADFNNWFVDPINLIPYLRGESNNTTLRSRASVLGDIINSDPVYVSPPLKSRYRDSDFSGEKYSEFVENNKSRIAMIFVGANDGLLHGFNADTGNEVLGFFPSKVLPNLKKLSKKDYQHQFYVDGTPTVASIFDDVSKTWRTLLVGGLRRGGQGIYALDVTNPNDFKKSDTKAAKVVRWEFGDNDDADFGYSYSQPQIMQLNDGKFYVVVGNGYNNTEADLDQSTTGNAVLYLLNIADGTIKKKISTSVGTSLDPSGRGISNGLATVTGYDVKNDGKVDYVYAGDLFGNLWKFNLTSNDSNDWGAPLKLFTACAGDVCKTGTDNNHQPITVPIEVADTEYGKTMIYFGTGKFLEARDLKTSNIELQTIYGLIDKNIVIPSRSALLEQKIIYSGVADGSYGSDIRVTTNSKIRLQKGWYMDIKVPVYKVTDTFEDKINQTLISGVTYKEEGEQILSRARYSKGVITFFTKATSSEILDPCTDIAAKSFLLELNALSGSRLGSVRSDVNKDGVIDSKDSLDTGTTNTLGKKKYIVISGQSGGNGSESLDIGVIGSDNNVTDQVISLRPGNGGDAAGPPPGGKVIKAGYRVSWREIFKQ